MRSESSHFRVLIYFLLLSLAILVNTIIAYDSQYTISMVRLVAGTKFAEVLGLKKCRVFLILCRRAAWFAIQAETGRAVDGFKIPLKLKKLTL